MAKRYGIRRIFKLIGFNVVYDRDSGWYALDATTGSKWIEYAIYSYDDDMWDNELWELTVEDNR
jgi:hypothetical protein